MLLSGIFCQRKLKVVHYFNLSNERGFLYLHIFIHGPFIHLSFSLYPMHGGRRAEPILAIMGARGGAQPGMVANLFLD